MLKVLVRLKASNSEHGGECGLTLLDLTMRRLLRLRGEVGELSSHKLEAAERMSRRPLRCISAYFPVERRPQKQARIRWSTLSQALRAMQRIYGSGHSMSCGATPQSSDVGPHRSVARSAPTS